MQDIEIKGPFSYSGNKYKIYKSHLSNLMYKFDRVHEPFLGSGVCIYNSNNGGIGIDKDENVIALHNSLFDDNLIDKIKETYKNYFPKGRDKDCYMNLRKDFNKSYLKNKTGQENAHMLHLLVQLSFNSLLRFSKNGFNVPFGMKEVDITRIENHQKVLKSKNIEFKCGSYREIDLSKIDATKDVIYLDPPYIASKYQYGGWNKKDELELLDFLDMINLKGYKFILSNTFIHRKVVNEDLVEWSKKYKVKSINMSYNSWAAAVASVKSENDTQEVIITNF